MSEQGMTELDIVEVTSTSLDGDGFIGAQPDWMGDSTASGSEAQVHHPLGFIAMPLDPTKDKVAPTALRMYEGGTPHLLFLIDPRQMAALPNWKPGDSAQYSPSGKGNYFRAKYDGTCSIRVLDSSGRDVFYTVNTSGANGLGFTESAPWGSRLFNETGWHLQTQWGACVDVGGYSDGGPLSQLGMKSSFKVRADSVSLAGASVKLGSGEGHTPVAMAQPVLALLSDFVTALQALSKSLQTFIPGSGGASFDPTGLVQVTEAIQVLSAAVSATPNSVSSTTTNAL